MIQKLRYEYCIMVSRMHPDGTTYHPMTRWTNVRTVEGEMFPWYHLGEPPWGIANYTIVEQEPPHFPAAAPIHGKKPVEQQLQLI